MLSGTASLVTRFGSMMATAQTAANRPSKGWPSPSSRTAYHPHRPAAFGYRSGAYRSVTPAWRGFTPFRLPHPNLITALAAARSSVVDANGAATFTLTGDENNDTIDIGVVAQSYFGGDFIAGMVYDDLSQDGVPSALCGCHRQPEQRRRRRGWCDRHRLRQQRCSRG